LVREAVVELEGSFAKADNTRLVRAHARLAGHKKGQSLIHAGGIIVRAARVVLDTVTRTALPPLPGLDQVQTITAESRINLRELPPRLLVLGGSNIALEMAQPFRRLGSEATILQKADQLAEREDADAAEVLTAAYPYAVFTTPELGRVGLSEQQALHDGRRIKIGKRSMADSGKARELGKTEGFIKVIIDADTDAILGATALCEQGSELVQLSSSS
jgi:pyruvate/2-oxoglutarate dehydrogenase complex dihydrolipoamide dehydrogenase (E3) component